MVVYGETNNSDIIERPTVYFITVEKNTSLDMLRSVKKETNLKLMLWLLMILIKKSVRTFSMRWPLMSC
jgi:hypothetical protein